MINLEIRNNKRVNGYSSKGNVPKWLIGNTWYKLDAFGYEGLSEYMVSHLLKKTNVKNFLIYDLKKVLYKGEKIASVSKNFLHKNEEIVTIERLHLAETGFGLIEKITSLKNIKEKIEYVVDFIEKKTNVKDFHTYLTILMEIDMFFLNEDRHTNNIALIRNIDSKKYKIAPIFDNGLSLLSDLNDYKLDEDIYKNINKVKAKPFSIDFEKETEIAESLFGQQLNIYFDKKDIDTLLENAKNYYPSEIINRVRMTLYEQIRKYQYLIKEK